jgi:hypothetical protein
MLPSFAYVARTHQAGTPILIICIRLPWSGLGLPSVAWVTLEDRT